MFLPSFTFEKSEANQFHDQGSWGLQNQGWKNQNLDRSGIARDFVLKP